MKNIILSSDSTIDLSKELLSEYKIYSLPLYIHLDNKEYKDMIDIDADYIYEYYEKHIRILIFFETIEKNFE